MYLSLFAVLFIIYQYMNEKHIFGSQQNTIGVLQKKLGEAKKMNDSLRGAVTGANYFSLMHNEGALDYLEATGHAPGAVQTQVMGALYDKNTENGGNPLVPFAGLNGPMLINKVKLLNHRWAIADFTDGRYWGEMVVEYFINKDGGIDFNVIGSVLFKN